MRHLPSVLLTPHLHSFFFHGGRRHALDVFSTRNSPAPQNWLLTPLCLPVMALAVCPLQPSLLPVPSVNSTPAHRGLPLTPARQRHLHYSGTEDGHIPSPSPLGEKRLGPHDPFRRSRLPPGRALLPSHSAVSDRQQRIKGRSWGSSMSSKVPGSLDHPTEGDLPLHEGPTYPTNRGNTCPFRAKENKYLVGLPHTLLPSHSDPGS